MCQLNLSNRSVVVGAESLLTDVYKSFNEPQLRPCLQRTSEASLAFVKYDLSMERPPVKQSIKSKLRAKKRKKNNPTQNKNPSLNTGKEVKVGTVLVSFLKWFV